MYVNVALAMKEKKKRKTNNKTMLAMRKFQFQIEIDHHTRRHRLEPPMNGNGIHCGVRFQIYNRSWQSSSLQLKYKIQSTFYPMCMTKSNSNA